MALVTLDEVRDALNLGDDVSHDEELERYIDAAEAHVADKYRPFDATTYTERLTTSYDGHGGVRLMPSRYPVTAVTSVTDWSGSSSYLADFTVSASGNFVSHASLTAGEWDVTYTVAPVTAPADLKLAVLEDIRGLYQPGQVGPLASFGAFGAESTDTGETYRPVRMWPRIDAWIAHRMGPVIA